MSWFRVQVSGSKRIWECQTIYEREGGKRERKGGKSEEGNGEGDMNTQVMV